MSDEIADPSGRMLAYRNPSTLLACFAALAFLVLGLRGVFDPEGAANTFGIAISGDGLAYMAATGARNVGLALLALAMVYFDLRRALAFLLIAAAIIAAFDFWIVWNAASFGKAAKHIGYVVFLFGFGVFFVREGWRR